MVGGRLGCVAAALPPFIYTFVQHRSARTPLTQSERGFLHLVVLYV